jgi:hypothetical protein
MQLIFNEKFYTINKVEIFVFKDPNLSNLKILSQFKKSNNLSWREI